MKAQSKIEVSLTNSENPVDELFEKLWPHSLRTLDGRLDLQGKELVVSIDGLTQSGIRLVLKIVENETQKTWNLKSMTMILAECPMLRLICNVE